MVEQQTSVTIEPSRAAEMWRSGEAHLVDVRRPYELGGARIEGAIAIEMNELSARAGEIPRDRPVIFYCRTGNRSGMAAQAFREAGWDAFHIGGGIYAWADDGLPLDPPDAEIRDPLPAS